MLVFNFTSIHFKIRSYCFIIFFSISFCQYVVVPQRPIFDFLKWEEIKSSNILIQKVGPLINPDLEFSSFTSFYYSNTQRDRILAGEIFPEVTINNTDGTRLRIYGNAAILLNDKLMIQNEFEFDNKGESEPHFQGFERGFKNGWVGYLQHSSLTYDYQKGYLAIGRGNPYYYNMNESLLLNPHFPPAEYVMWQHEVQWFQYNWGFMMLNAISKDTGLEKENRFLTYHRYGINRDKWRIGFTEAVLVHHEIWSSREVEYLLPSSVLIETEANNGVNANLIWLFDIMYKYNNWTIYSEFMVDDYAINGKSPPQIASVIGLGKSFKNFLLNMEYTRINRWVGNHCDSLNIWINSDVPIGHELGPDAHKLQISSYMLLNKNVSFEILVGFLESGDGTAIQRLVEPWPEGIKCDQDFNYGKEGSFPTKSNTNIFYHIRTNYLFKEKLMFNLLFNNKSEINFKITLRI